jgi:rhamnosyltransferase
MAPETSIIVRTLNEEKFLPHLLEGIRAQNYTDWEIIVVDSGSRDDTLNIAARYTEHILHIDLADFTFGRALNLGCQHARGRYLVLVSAHVYPASNNWLGDLVEPFSEPAVAMVYGRQRAGDENRLSERMDLYRNYGPTSRVLVDQPNGNNGNAAVRGELWLEEPFDESLPGLEDIDWARKFQQRGYRIYYAADAAAYHIHEESLRQVYRRFFREAVAYKRIFPDSHFTFADAVKGFTYTVSSDVLYAVRARDLNQLVQVPGTRIAEFLGTYRGHREHMRIGRAVIEGLRPPDETEAVVVEGPSQHGLKPRPVPTPGPGEVLVQVAYVSVDSRDVSEASAGPHVPGHVCSGAVLATGAGVRGLHPGDRVVVAGVDGAYARHLVVPSSRVWKTPRDIPFKTATLLALVSECVDRVGRAVRAPGRACVVGAGPRGNLCAQLLRNRGLDVTVVEGDARWLKLLHKYELNTLTVAPPEDGFATYVVEDEEPAAGGKGRDGNGTAATTRDAWREAVRVLASGSLDLSDHIGVVLPLESYEQAWDGLRDGRFFNVLLLASKELESV